VRLRDGFAQRELTVIGIDDVLRRRNDEIVGHSPVP